MPRHQRVLSETGIYHVMMRGNERRKLFQDEEDKQAFLDTLFVKKEDKGFLVYAYCLMDNHVHLLVKEGSESLATMMKRINTSYAYYFNQKNHRVGHLFQDRFKSEPIEDERYLLAVIRYIHNNPVKAGIVQNPEQYKWSSYNSYLYSHKPELNIVDTQFILSILDNGQKTAIQEFKNFSMELDEREFLDIEQVNAWMEEEGKYYLEEYLKKRWPGENLEDLMNKEETRTEIIVELKTNTRLSVRTIAALLGINRGVVQRTKVN